jgi:hypothetical protein
MKISSSSAGTRIFGKFCVPTPLGVHEYNIILMLLNQGKPHQIQNLFWTTLTTYQFHVDKLSSAHIYLRMRDGETWDNLPNDLLTDLAQLTKANSIEGNKKDNITIIYTPWSNLRKDGSMEVGQVGFHDPRKASFPAPSFAVAAAAAAAAGIFLTIMD